MTARAKKLSLEDFLRNLNDSGLFSLEELDEALSALPGPPAADGEAAAQLLIAAGKLTPFQAAAVGERRFAELVIGNYQVLDRLGAGGMGTVYKARHRRMKRLVALKVLARSIGQEPKLVQRFQREVEAVARLSHPNIVMAHDADEAEAGPFLVMEFVNGRDLATEVEQRGLLPIREAVGYIIQAARGLDYAHGQGIIHRDIKPANLLRDQSGVVKVADLGLARFHDPFGGSEDGRGLTSAGMVMGTVEFMPPEQAQDMTNLDHRADIYSLGCTLYYLLTGRTPFPGPTAMAVLLKHRDAPIPSLRATRSDVPAALDAVFQRMAAKRPEDRFASMAEVVRALESLTLGPEPSAGQPPEPAGRPPGAPAPTVAPMPWTVNATALPGPADAPINRTIGLELSGTPQAFSPKVLLVEPSRTQSSIIRKYLQAQGIQHLVAVASGQEALREVRSERPDAILCALHLADMTGVELAQQVRSESQAAAPGFVLISSADERSDVTTLSGCGQAIVLHKPFTPEQLHAALQMVAAVQRVPAPAKARGNLRVLIADDSAAARRHLQSVLAGVGLAHFVEAGDGAQAVAAVARESFDLIVTDYNMPYLDARGLVGYLKQNPSTASIPIILVTTEQDPAKLEAVRQLGVAAVCDKSPQPDILEKILDQLVPTP